MTREVWPKPVTVAALKKVVCLAVNRYGKETKKRRTYPPSPWAVRFNVMGYPQFRFVDGWGRALRMSTRVGRTPQHIAKAVDRALAALPEGDAAKPWKDPDLRLAYWRSQLERKRSTKALRKGFLEESDPLIRLAILDYIATKPKDRDALHMLEQAAKGNNDWVRQRSFAILASAPSEGSAKILATAIDRVLDGGSGWPNPNNMLVAAAKAAIGVAHPILIRPLGDILAKHKSNNTATYYAVQALDAIGKAHGHKRVVPFLEPTDAYEGWGAERIQKIVLEMRKAAKRG